MEGAHPVLALELDSAGRNVWVADAGGFITAIYFDLATTSLILVRRSLQLYFLYHLSYIQLYFSMINGSVILPFNSYFIPIFRL